MGRLFLIVLLLLVPRCAYADVIDIIGLPQDNSPTTDDITVTVDSPGTTAKQTKKATFGAIRSLMLAGDGSNLTGLTQSQITGTMAESNLTFTNITTNNVTTSKHGFVPVAPNDASKYLDGTGAFSVPSAAAAGGFTDDGTIVHLTASTDNLGIGTTIAPTKVYVSGALTATGIITGSSFVGNASTATLAAGATSLAANGANCAAGSYPLGVDAAGAVEGCTVSGAGSVTSGTANRPTYYTGATTVASGTGFDNGTNRGIGTTLNTNKLDVAGGVAVGTTNAGYVVAPSNGLIVQGNTGVGTISPSSLLEVGARKLNVLSSGNVGVGSISPGAAVDVQGAVRASSGFLGNSTTATALAANGANCTTGNYPLGVDASGAVESCTTIGSLSQWKATNVGIYTAEPVGIGTTYSGNKLTILGSVGIGTISYSTYLTTAAPTGGMLIEGNVGIGSINPTQALDVNGTVKATAVNTASSSTPQVDFYPTLASDTHWIAGVAGEGGNDNDDNFVLSEGTTFNSSNRITVFPGGNIYLPGNVGLGTTNAQTKLVVAGEAFFKNIGGNEVAFDANGTNYPVFYTDSTTSNLYFGPTTVVGTNPTAPILTFGADSGNVGIGTTMTSAKAKFAVIGGNVGIGSITPGQALDVQGTVRATSFSGSGASLTGISSSQWTTATNDVIYNTGGVGIGTTVPIGTGDFAEKLASKSTGDTYDSNVFKCTGITNGSGNACVKINGPTDTAASAMRIQVSGETLSRFLILGTGAHGWGPGSGTRDVFIDRSATNTLRVSTDGAGGTTAKFVVSGNIGVGTTVPPNPLYVVGTAMFTTGLNVGIGTATMQRVCLNSGALYVGASCP